MPKEKFKFLNLITVVIIWSFVKHKLAVVTNANSPTHDNMLFSLLNN